MNLITQKYNFLEKAYSSKGYKHSGDSIVKIHKSRLGVPLSKEIKKKLSNLFSGEGNPFFGKKHPDLLKQKLSNIRKGSLNPIFHKKKSKEFLFHIDKEKTGKFNHMSKPIQLCQIYTKEMLTFESQIEAALYLGYKSKSPIVKALKSGSLVKKQWKISSFKKDISINFFAFILFEIACWNASSNFRLSRCICRLEYYC